MSKLVIVGTVAFDAIETPFGKTDKILGGAATYIGFSAANFDNVDAAAVSVVGGDFPQEYLDLLTDRNVNIDGIEIVKDGKTFFWSGRYHNDMNSRDTLATELNVLETFTPVVPKDYQNADIVMLGNLHPLTQQSLIDQMSKKKIPTIITKIKGSNLRTVVITCIFPEDFIPFELIQVNNQIITNPTETAITGLVSNTGKK